VSKANLGHWRRAFLQKTYSRSAVIEQSGVGRFPANRHYHSVSDHIEANTVRTDIGGCREIWVLAVLVRGRNL
jgi:hypothetical protein